MPLEQTPRGAVQRFWRWIKNQFIRTVPQDIAVCEFDCRKPQCFQGEWETCEKRLPALAGELKPSQISEEIHTKTETDN